MNTEELKKIFNESWNCYADTRNITDDSGTLSEGQLEKAIKEDKFISTAQTIVRRAFIDGQLTASSITKRMAEDNADQYMSEERTE
jgi:hypothetical protein